MIDWYEGDKIIAAHELKALRSQGRVVTAMMADLVEYGALEKIGPSYSLAFRNSPRQVLPR